MLHLLILIAPLTAPHYCLRNSNTNSKIQIMQNIGSYLDSIMKRRSQSSSRVPHSQSRNSTSHLLAVSVDESNLDDSEVNLDPVEIELLPMQNKSTKEGVHQFQVPLLTIQEISNDASSILENNGDMETARAPRALSQSLSSTERSWRAKSSLSCSESGRKHVITPDEAFKLVENKHHMDLLFSSPLPSSDNTDRPTTLRLPSIATEISFRETSPAFMALQQNRGIEEDLGQALQPLNYYRKLFSKTGGANFITQHLTVFGMVALCIYGLAMCVLCYLRQKQAASENLEETFGGGAINIWNLFVHFLQGLVGIYYAFRTDERLPTFIELWLETYASCENEHPPTKELRRIGIFFGLYVLVGTIVLTVIWCVGFMEVTPWLSFVDNCDCFFPPVAGAPRLMNGILLGLVTLPNLYCQAIYAMLCMILYYEFWHFDRQFFTVYQSENPEAFLAAYRQQHHQLIRLTDFVDDHLSYYAWAIYSFNLPSICLVLYALFLDKQLDIGAIIGIIYALNLALHGLCVWGTQLIVQMLLISIPPAAITFQEFASRPRDPRLDRDWMVIAAKDTNLSTARSVMPVTQDAYQQITLFLQQLTSRVIGITCGGFFMLTKEMLLTLVSVLITYFALILQLDVGDGTKCNCICNATTTQ